MIKVSQFGGEAPLFSPETLPLPFAALAMDCMFDSGSLRGFGATEPTAHTVRALSKDAALYIPEAGVEYLMCFPQRTDFIFNAHAGDSWKRAYWFSDTHPPRYGAHDVIIGQDGAYPSSYYLLGMPAPEIAPIVTVVGATDSNGNAIDHTALGDDPLYRSVTYTYVNDYGEESGPYLPSDGSALPSVVMYDGDKLHITNMVPLSGNYPLTAGKIRVYQTNTAGNFVRMAEIAMSAGEVTYVNTDPSGAQLSTGLTMPPVSGMKGACLTSYGYMVGFAGNTLYCSDAYLYHSWPTSYAKPCKFEILRVFPSPQGAYVLTTGGPYLLVGTDPANTQLVDVITDDVCLSAESACDVGGACVYASQNGLSMLSDSGVQGLTNQVFNHLSWSKLSPAKMKLVRHSGQVVCFGEGASWVYTQGSAETQWVRSSITADVAFTEPETGAMLMGSQGKALVRFDSRPNANASYEWVSPRIDLPSPVPYACYRAHAEEFSDLQFRVLCDGRPVNEWTQLPVDAAHDGYVYGRLPSYRLGRGIQVAFKGTSQMYEFLLASSFKEMKSE